MSFFIFIKHFSAVYLLELLNLKIVSCSSLLFPRVFSTMLKTEENTTQVPWVYFLALLLTSHITLKTLHKFHSFFICKIGIINFLTQGLLWLCLLTISMSKALTKYWLYGNCNVSVSFLSQRQSAWAAWVNYFIIMLYIYCTKRFLIVN